MVNDAGVMTMEELATFLESSDAVTFKGRSRKENYAWIEGTLRRYKYTSRARAEKGLLRRYLEKMTGYSQAQLSRLIAEYRRTGHVRLPEYQRHRFLTKYSRADQALLAEVDNAHSRLSGPATQAILRREYEVYGRNEFAQLSEISVAHLYRLRKMYAYRQHCLTVHKTNPKQAHRRTQAPGPTRKARLPPGGHGPPRRSGRGEGRLPHQHDRRGHPVGDPGLRGTDQRAPPRACAVGDPTSVPVSDPRVSRQQRRGVH